MKKLLVGASLLLLAVVVSAPVSAVYHNRDRGQEVREQVQTRIEEKKAQVLEHVQDLRNRSQELREQRRLERGERQATKRAEIATRVAELKIRVIENIKKVFTRILDRMTAAHDRLDKIVDKINTRIAKLKEKGVNTTPAETALAACGNVETAIDSAIGDAKAKVAGIDPQSSRVRDAVHTANSSVRGAKRALQNYHKCLVGVIRTLRASLPKEASPSAATESAE